MAKTYAGVGSRDTPQDMLDLMYRMAKVLCDLGWVGNSGEAPGADWYFHEGARVSRNYGPGMFNAIIPWNGFKTQNEVKVYEKPGNNIYVMDNYRRKKAEVLGIGARKTLAGLNTPGKVALHARNAMQVLGMDLRSPIKFLVCWAKPVGKEGKVSGGTNTAVALALHFGIDVINLATPHGLGRALAFLEEYEEVA